MPKHSVAASLVADDASQLIARCGKPQRDHRKADGTFRDLTYPGITLHYFQGSDGGWDFMSGTPTGKDATVVSGQIAEVLPCFAVTAKPATHVDSVASDTGVNSDHSTAIGVFILLLILTALYVLYRYGAERAWKQRPRRLCLACRSIRQPLRHKDNRWYCGVCQADNPVPLESPAALEYFHAHPDNRPL